MGAPIAPAPRPEITRGGRPSVAREKAGSVPGTACSPEREPGGAPRSPPKSGFPGPAAARLQPLRPPPGPALHAAFPSLLCRTHPGLSRRGRGAFRSPRPSPKAAQADGASRGSLHLDVERLREERDSLEREIAQLLSDGLCVEELDEHISRLHEYNDIKDVGQMLLGKLAVLRGVTTKELYAEFDLDLSD